MGPNVPGWYLALGPVLGAALGGLLWSPFVVATRKQLLSVIMSTGLKIKTWFRTNETILCYLHQWKCLPSIDVPFPFPINTPCLCVLINIIWASA